MKNLDTIVQLLHVALTNSAPVEQDESTEPLAGANVTTIGHGYGIRSSADHRVAESMMPKADPGRDAKPLDLEWFAEDPEGAIEAYERQWTDLAAYQTEVEGRRKPLNEGRDAKAAQRMRRVRARKDRAKQFESIAKSTKRPKKERMEAAWRVVVPMAPIVDEILSKKRRWAEQYLGSAGTDDVYSTVIENMATMLAKSDQDLVLLLKAASSFTERLPGDQDDRKEIGKARKWLMSMANNRVMDALVNAYREAANLRWENLDKIDTVMAAINGSVENTQANHHKASRAPASIGAHWQRPGSINQDILSMVIAGAITHRRLDPLVELLLADENLRSDGSFKWTENAETVFRCSPDGNRKWDLVVRATQAMKDPRAARGDAARQHTRNVFEFLPGLIVDAVECFDYETSGIAIEKGHVQATVQNVFDCYLERRGPRSVGRVALSFASPEQAALAIAENLATLVSGKDMVDSIRYA